MGYGWLQDPFMKPKVAPLTFDLIANEVHNSTKVLYLINQDKIQAVN